MNSLNSCSKDKTQMIANIPIKYHINHFEIISKILKSHVQFIFTHNPQYRTRYKNSQQISRNIFLKKKKKKRESALIQTDHEGYFSRVMWASFAFPTLTVLLLLLLPYNLSSKLIPGRPKRILESYAAPSFPLSFSLPLFGPALNN